MYENQPARLSRPLLYEEQQCAFQSLGLGPRIPDRKLSAIYEVGVLSGLPTVRYFLPIFRGLFVLCKGILAALLHHVRCYMGYDKVSDQLTGMHPLFISTRNSTRDSSAYDCTIRTRSSHTNFPNAWFRFAWIREDRNIWGLECATQSFPIWAQATLYKACY